MLYWGAVMHASHQMLKYAAGSEQPFHGTNCSRHGSRQHTCTTYCCCRCVQGGWEDDETLEAAARRETVEEAGVRGSIEVSRDAAQELVLRPRQEAHVLQDSSNCMQRGMACMTIFIWIERCRRMQLHGMSKLRISRAVSSCAGQAYFGSINQSNHLLPAWSS